MTKTLSRKGDANRTYGPWAIRRCDIYVISFVPTLIELRLEIVSDLWKAGLKADLVSSRKVRVKRLD